MCVNITSAIVLRITTMLATALLHHARAANGMCLLNIPLPPFDVQPRPRRELTQ